MMPPLNADMPAGQSTLTTVSVELAGMTALCRTVTGLCAYVHVAANNAAPASPQKKVRMIAPCSFRIRPDTRRGFAATAGRFRYEFIVEAAAVNALTHVNAPAPGPRGFSDAG
jgi:hypothetical protein